MRRAKGASTMGAVHAGSFQFPVLQDEAVMGRRAGTLDVYVLQLAQCINVQGWLNYGFWDERPVHRSPTRTEYNLFRMSRVFQVGGFPDFFLLICRGFGEVLYVFWIEYVRVVLLNISLNNIFECKSWTITSNETFEIRVVKFKRLYDNHVVIFIT